MKKISVIVLATLLLATGLGTQGLLATPDGALTIRYQATGRYDIVAAGVGLTGATEGDINLLVPGKVIKAYLYWAGYEDSDLGSDDTVNFVIDGGLSTSLTADAQYGPDWWWGNNYHYVYVEDVTGLVATGDHTYTISDVTINFNYGVGLMVVYEDPSLPNNLVKIYDGLDSLHFRFDSPQGPDSEVTCVELGAAQVDRDMKITMFVGGVQHDNRPNAIWYQTGTGGKPTDLVDELEATELDGPPYPYPLGAYDGTEWDTYTNSITVPADNSWACLQIESADTAPPYGSNNEGLGSSALYLASGFVIPISGTGTPGYWKNHPDAWPVDEITIGGITYAKDEAIAILNTPEKGDKTYTMFRALVAAKLNVIIGNPSSCIDDTIIDADAWMGTNPVGTRVKGKSDAWKVGEPLAKILDDYNNGLLCAPPRD